MKIPNIFFYKIFLFIIVLCPFALVHADIQRTLSFGSSGSDVKELQVFLNTNPATQIASVGPGSPGMENGYFGLLTKQAVMKFQALYAPEVLFPAGIYKPTGTVGPLSRAKIHAVLALNTTQQTTIGQVSTVLPASIQTKIPSFVGQPTSTAAYFSPEYKKELDGSKMILAKSKPLLFTISKYQARHGDTVTITGNGFLSAENTVVIGRDYRLEHISSSDGATIQFRVPNEVPNNSYNVWIENKNGSTYHATASNFFTVTDNPQKPPEISSIAPLSVEYSTSNSIVITGSGFTEQGNSIYSQFGTVTGVSSLNGTEIRVPVSSFPGIAQLSKNQSSVHGQKIPVTIVIQNAHGYSKSITSFFVQF